MDLQSYYETLMRRGDGEAFTNSELHFLINQMEGNRGAYQASKLISTSFATTTKAAVLGFDLLEAILSSPALSSDHQFRAEIGKNRFLNKIIRLLSPKYDGLSTPDRIKSRAITFIQHGVDPNNKWFQAAEQSKISSIHKSLVDSGLIQQQNDLEAVRKVAAEYFNKLLALATDSESTSALIDMLKVGLVTMERYRKDETELASAASKINANINVEEQLRFASKKRKLFPE